MFSSALSQFKWHSSDSIPSDIKYWEYETTVTTCHLEPHERKQCPSNHLKQYGDVLMMQTKMSDVHVARSGT